MVRVHIPKSHCTFVNICSQLPIFYNYLFHEISDFSKSHRRAAVGQAQVYQFVDVGGGGGHDGIASTPGEVQSAGGFWPGRAGKDHGMHKAPPFPPGPPPQNPAGTNTPNHPPGGPL
ncbi:MAG: hypothetical protein H8E62_08220, partial [Planctomycetes bacterium]|nr:hypothetical protein [Planctomycetota bacterium]